MFDEQHGDRPGQRLEQLDKPADLDGGQPGGRFVEEQQAGATGQGHGDLQLAALAVREVPGGHRRDGGEPHLVQQRGRPGAARRVGVRPATTGGAG